MDGKKIGLAGLIMVMLCGCADFKRGYAEARAERNMTHEEKVAARKERENQREEERQDELDQQMGLEKKSTREEYVRAHPDLDEMDKQGLLSGWRKIADAEKRRMERAEWKAKEDKWDKEAEERRAAMEKRRENYLATSDRPFKDAVAKSKVAVGMTMEEVLISKQRLPEHRTRTVFANIETEFWSYGSLSVSFENGILRSFTEEH